MQDDGTSNVASAMVNQWLEEVDTDHDREISLDELVSWAVDHVF